MAVVLSVLCNETKTWIRQKVDETKTTVFESSNMTFSAELQSDAFAKLKKNPIHLLIESFIQNGGNEDLQFVQEKV